VVWLLFSLSCHYLYVLQWVYQMHSYLFGSWWLCQHVCKLPSQPSAYESRFATKNAIRNSMAYCKYLLWNYRAELIYIPEILHKTSQGYKTSHDLIKYWFEIQIHSKYTLTVKLLFHHTMHSSVLNMCCSNLTLLSIFPCNEL